MDRNLMLSAVAVLAVTGVSVDRSHAQTGVNTAGSIYRLNEGTTYQTGCFDPCLCPLMIEVPVRGTFRLGAPNIGDVHDFYPVTEVNWMITQWDGSLMRVTGEGTYIRTNFGDPMHALMLDLSIDGAPVQHFYSDEGPAGDDLSNIQLTVSINGMFCHDTVFVIDALRLPASQIHRYRVQPMSRYQEGCFDPCDCLLFAPTRFIGGMGLVRMGQSNTHREYAVVNIRWRIPQPPTSNAAVSVTGFGWLRTPLPGSGGMQHFSAELMFDNDGPFHFETVDNVGWDWPMLQLPNAVEGPSNVLTPVPLPWVHTTIAMNNMVCFDRVFRLFAGPAHLPTAIAP